MQARQAKFVQGPLVEIYVLRSTYFKDTKYIRDWNKILEGVGYTTVSMHVVGTGKTYVLMCSYFT